MVKSKHLLALIVLLLMPVAFANANYTESGFPDGSYDSARSIDGFFNANIDEAAVALNAVPKSLDNAHGTPLVEDLDNDGVKEVIVNDAGNIEILRFNAGLDSWSTIDSFAIGGTRWSNMVLFDIDSDNLSEILIIAENVRTVYILNYSNSDLQNQTSFVPPQGSFTPDLQSALKCDVTDGCFIAFSDNFDIPNTGLPEVHNTFVARLGATTTTDVHNVQLAGGADLFSYCFPKIRTMAYADADSDGDTELVFSALKTYSTTSFDELLGVWTVSLTGNGSLQTDSFLEITDVDDVLEDSSNCIDSNAGSYVTSPIVKDGGDGGNAEIWVGANVNEDEFRLYMLEEGAVASDCSNILDGDGCNRFPDFAVADGRLVSNLFAADVFGSSGGQNPDGNSEVCVLGLETDDSISDQCSFGLSDCIDILCASKESSQGGNDQVEYFFNDPVGTFGFGISNASQDWYVTTHFVDTVGGASPEVMTSYGIFDLDGTSCTGSSCEITNIWDNPENDGVSIPIDYSDSGNFDIIHMSRTQLTYIDDLFKNTAPTVSCEANPCLDSIIAINSTVQVSCDINDPDDDNINITAKLYAGEDNEQETIVPTRAEGNGITFSFDGGFNKTTGTSTLSVFVQDTEGNFNTVTDTFSVSNNGVEFGDCSSTFGDTLPEDEPVAAGADTVGGLTGEDSLSTGTNAVTTAFNLTPFLFFMLLMLFTTFGIIFSGFAENNPFLAFLSIILANTLLLIIGTKLGAIPVGIIITVVVIGIIVLGVWIAKAFTGNSTSS